MEISFLVAFAKSIKCSRHIDMGTLRYEVADVRENPLFFAALPVVVMIGHGNAAKAVRNKKTGTTCKIRGTNHHHYYEK